MNKPLLHDRLWLWYDSCHYPQVSFSKPDQIHEAVEYMRVLNRAEVERLGKSDEGVDVQQQLNSMQRTIDGQRKTINRMARESNEDAR